jgi:hypothetical protein
MSPVVTQPIRWFDDEQNSPQFWSRWTREGWCYFLVQAITVAIDQDAEAATENREYFWNKPRSIGGSRRRRPLTASR